jgi:hypothetical protein
VRYLYRGLEFAFWAAAWAWTVLLYANYHEEILGRVDSRTGEADISSWQGWWLWWTWWGGFAPLTLMAILSGIAANTAKKDLDPMEGH